MLLLVFFVKSAILFPEILQTIKTTILRRESDAMRHIFILNPKAGKGDRIRQIQAMADTLQQRHAVETLCLYTQSAGHATTLARSLAETGEPLRLYACGGDGTTNEVANGIAGFDNAAMTTIPMGTGNDFLKNFGPDQERFRDPEQLWDGPVTALDLIDCGGRYALTLACSGIDAQVAADVHKYSSTPLLGGKGSYIASLLVNFLFKGIGSHWTVSLDGVAMTDDFSLVTVCNGRYYGGGFFPVPEANMTDGVLNTLVVKKVSRRTFAQFVVPYSKGEYWRFPQYARCYTAKEIRITSEQEDIVTCLDGEAQCSSDVRFCLADKKVRFFAPKGADPNATWQPPHHVDASVHR